MLGSIKITNFLKLKILAEDYKNNTMNYETNVYFNSDNLPQSIETINKYEKDPKIW